MGKFHFYLVFIAVAVAVADRVSWFNPSTYDITGATVGAPASSGTSAVSQHPQYWLVYING